MPRSAMRKQRRSLFPNRISFMDASPPPAIVIFYYDSKSIITTIEDGRYQETDVIPTPKLINDLDSDPNATVVDITFRNRLGSHFDTMNGLKNLGLNVVKAKVHLHASEKYNKFAISKS